MNQGNGCPAWATSNTGTNGGPERDIGIRKEVLAHGASLVACTEVPQVFMDPGSHIEMPELGQEHDLNIGFVVTGKLR